MKNIGMKRSDKALIIASRIFCGMALLTVLVVIGWTYLSQFPPIRVMATMFNDAHGDFDFINVLIIVGIPLLFVVLAASCIMARR